MSLAEFLAKYPRARAVERDNGNVFVTVMNCASFLDPERSNATHDLHRLSDYSVRAWSMTFSELVPK